MSRRISLSYNWYSEKDDKIFKKKSVTLKPGITVIVGCNGYGKTTFLKQLESKLKNTGIPVFFHSNYTNGESKRRSAAGLYGDFNFIAQTLTSSEGENIVNVMEQVAREIGRFVYDNKKSDELWVLFDAIDSGLSIDNIIEIKDFLRRSVMEEEWKTVYVIISTNAYEFARNENCFDVCNGKYIRFSDYEDYRDFILKSKDQKAERWET